MSKRKQQNIELERQLKKRNMVFRVISLAVVAVILFAIGFGFWTVQDSRWVLRYDGGRVATSDFRAIMDIRFGEFADNPAAREAAIGSLEHIVALHDRATQHNVHFTAEEREIAEAWVDSQIREQFTWWTEHGPHDGLAYIETRRLAELFATEPIAERLMDIYVPAHTVAVDEAELATMIEEYLEAELENYLDLELQMIMLFDREQIEEAYALIGTMAFDDILRQFSPEFADEEEIPPVPGVLAATWFDEQPEDREHILALAAGEYSDILELHDNGMDLYFIFYALSRTEPDADAAAEGFRERHVNEQRNEVFHALVADWAEEANFRVNRRGYNAV